MPGTPVTRAIASITDGTTTITADETREQLHVVGTGAASVSVSSPAGVPTLTVDVPEPPAVPPNAYFVGDGGYASLEAAVADLGSTLATLSYTTDQTLTANLTVPANIELMPLNGAKINHGSYTVSYAGSTARWPLAQIFSGTGAVAFGSRTGPILPQWWSSDVAGINKATAAAYASGGGEVYAPPGKYSGAVPVAVRDNVRLRGAGYATWIENTSTSGFSKCTVITGNLGDINGSNGIYAEAKYDLNAIAAGANTVTFANVGDAATFTEGDIVAIMSYETQPTDTRYPAYNDLNVVTAKDGADLTLRYAITDTYSAASGNPKIARLSGAVNGYDGAPLWMAKNSTVENLRITNATGLASGWYALFACGVGNTYRNLWVDNASGVIGSNGLSHSTLKDIKGSFDLRGIDMADFQVSTVLEDIEITRFGLNAMLPSNYMGVGIYSGTDVTVSRLKADLGGYGQVSLLYVNRGKILNPQVSKAGGGINVAILSGYGTDMEVTGGTIDGSERHGIYIVGERAKVRGNVVKNVGSTGTFYGINIRAAAVEYLIEGNVLGIAGSRTTKDRIVQDTATSASAIIQNNITYDAVPVPTYGTYTPTVTAVTNLDAVAARTARWVKVGAIVTVSGAVQVDPTTSTLTSEVGISLPVASDLTSLYDCAGTAVIPGVAGQSGAVMADTTNDRAKIQWKAGDTTAQDMFFTFSYTVK